MKDSLNTVAEKLRFHIWPLLLLTLAAFAVYGRLLNYGFLGNWDDNYYVLKNADISGFGRDRIKAVFSSYYVGNYAPVQMLSYMFDYAIWGLFPGGFHLSNLLLHICNSLLVYRLFSGLIADRLAAGAGAALFLLHPVQVETVGWISQRKNLLAMLFFLLAWECYRAYRSRSSFQRHYFYAASLLAFLLALLSKSIAVIFPAAMLLYDHCRFNNTNKPKLSDKVPYLLLSAVAAVLAIISQTPDPSEPSGGGRTAYHGGSPAATFITMLPVFCSYLRLIVWPSDLSALYDPAIYKSFETPVLLAFVFLSGLSLLIYCLYRFDRRIAFWPLFSFLALIPVSQIVPLVTLMNDRYLYFPLIGVSALLASGIKQTVERWPACHMRLLTGLAILLFVLSGVTFQRVGVWRDSITLWSDTVDKRPQQPLAWAALGEAFQNSVPPNFEESRKAYLRSIELDPVNNAFSLYSLGLLYLDHNDLVSAEKILDELQQRFPRHVMGLTALGDLSLKRLEYGEAERRYRKALSQQPTAVQILQRIGNLMIVQGGVDEARVCYLRIEELQSKTHPLNAYDLARVEALAGDTGASIKWLEVALERGYSNFDGILSDEELLPVIADARFRLLVEKYFPQRR